MRAHAACSPPEEVHVAWSLSSEPPPSTAGIRVTVFLSDFDSVFLSMILIFIMKLGKNDGIEGVRVKVGGSQIDFR